MHPVEGDVDALLATSKPRIVPIPVRAATCAPSRTLERTEWAVRGGIDDLTAKFEALRPNLAHVFPFELDTFQKEAVVHMEEVLSGFQGDAHLQRRGRTMGADSK